MGYIAAGLVLLILGAIGLQYSELKKFCVTTYSLPISKMESAQYKECFGRFVMLSDLHNQKYGKKNEHLLKAIDDAKPDFIIIAGDMLTAKPGYSMKTAIDVVQRLTKKYPVYYGNGNHEYRLRLYPDTYGAMYQNYKKILNEAGVHHLENESESIYLKNKKIMISGLEIDRKYYKRFKNIRMQGDYIQSVIGKKEDLYTILIAHNPDYFEQYATWGADLTLSGHVHGGIVRLPKIGGIISPRFRLFPKYSGGLYNKNGKKMIVSRGLGMHTFPIRIGNRAEIIIVNLVG